MLAGWKKAAAALLSCVLLAGCLYPKERLAQNQISTGEYIVLIHNAVQNYKARTGVLPINNSTAETPIYEKYVIDMKKLLDQRLISNVPADAFEGGGTYQYVIVNPEGEFQVKLLDLVAAQKAADLQRLVYSYEAREGKLPLGDRLSPSDEFYAVDYAQLGVQQEQVRSVYSGMYLSFVMHESGDVTIQYAPDIMKALELAGVASPDPQLDLRSYLIEQSPFVPTDSYPYYWKDGQPQLAGQ